MSRLSIRQVGKTFPGNRGKAPTQALQPVSLDVADNDFITVLGPSGCGKSTLLRLVAGLETPSTGQIIFGIIVIGLIGLVSDFIFKSLNRRMFEWSTL